MPDLLTHVLVAYTLATGLSWRVEWLTPRYVTVAMIGAASPDLNRFELLVPGAAIERFLGVPFDWAAFHTLGGSTLVIAAAAALSPARYRTRIVLALALGALSHHAFDLLLVNPSGHSYPVLWPVTQYHPATPGLLLSSDRWPALVAGCLAGVVWVLDRRSVGPAADDDH